MPRAGTVRRCNILTGHTHQITSTRIRSNREQPFLGVTQLALGLFSPHVYTLQARTSSNHISPESASIFHKHVPSQANQEGKQTTVNTPDNGRRGLSLLPHVRIISIRRASTTSSCAMRLWPHQGYDVPVPARCLDIAALQCCIPSVRTC